MSIRERQRGRLLADLSERERRQDPLSSCQRDKYGFHLMETLLRCVGAACRYMREELHSPVR